MTEPLLPGPPAAHCVCCGTLVPTGRLYQGHGEKCARQRGLIPPRIPRPRTKPDPDYPTLFDQLTEISDDVRSVTEIGGEW